MSIVWGDSAASESAFRIRKRVRPSSCSPAHRRIPPRISEFRGTGRFFRHATIRAPGSYPWQRLFSPEAPLLASGRRISNNNERNDARAFNLQRTIRQGGPEIRITADIEITELPGISLELIEKQIRGHAINNAACPLSNSMLADKQRCFASQAGRNFVTECARARAVISA
ncbi:hypothetical protein HN011_007187 [Eciton burchellii]|nr:hypothetical protein HN011_007187 [Eciton burchellii]